MSIGLIPTSSGNCLKIYYKDYEVSIAFDKDGRTDLIIFDSEDNNVTGKILPPMENLYGNQILHPEGEDIVFVFKAIEAYKKIDELCKMH